MSKKDSSLSLDAHSIWRKPAEWSKSPRRLSVIPARQTFDIHFISDGGDFENLIEKHGFALTRLEPRLTKEKIEFIAKVDRGEKFAPGLHRCRADPPRRERNGLSQRAQACCGRDWLLRDDPGDVPGSYDPPCLGRSIDLAPRFLLPWRGHDGWAPARALESGRRLVRAAIHQVLDQIRISQFHQPDRQDISAFRATTPSSSSGAATSRWWPSLPSFPGSNCRPTTSSSVPSSPGMNSQFPLKLRPFPGTSR